MAGALVLAPLKVALPLGIGDCHWACQKLAGLKALHPGRPLHAFVSQSPNHLTVNYLRLVPAIDEAFMSLHAPYDINSELPPDYRDPRWATLAGSANWKSFHYVAVANGHLESGARIEAFWPEVATQYHYPLNIRPKVRAWAEHFRGRVLLYPSGRAPNHGFHLGWWRLTDWVDVLVGLNAAGIKPVLVGAPTEDDQGYRDDLVRLIANFGHTIDATDMVGQTSTEQVMALIDVAGAFAGLNSGLGIVSAQLGTPTVILWADQRYPVGLASLHPNMQTSWLAPDQLASYRALSFGNPTTTAAAVVAALLEVQR